MASDTQNPLIATPQTTRVIVSNYACMSITIVVLVTRFGLSKLKWKRSLGLDDVFLCLALVAGIVESVLIEYAVRRGMGGFIRPGNALMLQYLAEVMYASDLIFLIAIFFAKISLVRLVYRFASKMAIRKGRLLVLQVVIGVWAAFAGPAIAFQCGGNLPWLYHPDRCVGSGALWYPTIILSVLIDAWLAICVWTALPEMQILPKQRQVILGLFGSRFLTCVFGIMHLAFLATALKSIDQSQAMPNPTVMKQLAMNASILTAAIPVLYKPLACYRPTPSAVIYTPEGREQTTTPLEDIKRPLSVALPNPKNFDSFEKETGSTPKLTLSEDKDDFASLFSLNFNKEIAVTSTKV